MDKKIFSQLQNTHEHILHPLTTMFCVTYIGPYISSGVSSLSFGMSEDSGIL